MKPTTIDSFVGKWDIKKVDESLKDLVQVGGTLEIQKASPKSDRCNLIWPYVGRIPCTVLPSLAFASERLEVEPATLVANKSIALTRVKVSLNHKQTEVTVILGNFDEETAGTFIAEAQPPLPVWLRWLGRAFPFLLRA